MFQRVNLLFLYPYTHWCLWEMEQAFGWDLEKWLFFGGYPGAAELADEEGAWKRYVTDSLIETFLPKIFSSCRQWLSQPY